MPRAHGLPDEGSHRHPCQGMIRISHLGRSASRSEFSQGVEPKGDHDPSDPLEAGSGSDSSLDARDRRLRDTAIGSERVLAPADLEACSADIEPDGFECSVDGRLAIEPGVWHPRSQPSVARRALIAGMAHTRRPHDKPPAGRRARRALAWAGGRASIAGICPDPVGDSSPSIAGPVSWGMSGKRGPEWQTSEARHGERSTSVQSGPAQDSGEVTERAAQQ